MLVVLQAVRWGAIRTQLTRWSEWPAVARRASRSGACTPALRDSATVSRALPHRGSPPVPPGYLGIPLYYCQFCLVGYLVGAMLPSSNLMSGVGRRVGCVKTPHGLSKREGNRFPSVDRDLGC